MKIRIDPCFSCTEGLQETHTQNNDSKSEDENVLKELNFDKTEQAYDSNTSNIIKIRDSLFARKDNIVIFVRDGEPCDDGSHLLTKDNKVPTIKDVTLGRARVIKQKQGCRYLIVLVVKTKVSTLEEETFKEPLRLLYDIILDLNL